MDGALYKNGLKWTYYDEDVIPAWVAEMDFGIAQPVTDALAKAVAEAQTGYANPKAIRRMVEAAVRFWADRFGWAVDPDCVLPAPDVVEGVLRVIHQLTPPGSPVVLPTPSYSPFFSMVERAGRESVEVPGIVDDHGRYTHDLDGIGRAIDNGAGSVVISSPWNPAGTVFSRSELADLIEVAGSRGARVISDEIHAPLVYPGAEHIAAAAVDPEVVVTVTSASKSFNLPGLKAAQIVLSNPEDRERWEFDPVVEMGSVGLFGLIANEAAYSKGGDWLDAVLSTLDSNRRLLAELLADRLPAARYRPPDATFLAWVDLRAYGHADPAEVLLEDGRVALTSCVPFGTDVEGYARLNFGTTSEVLTEVVDRMAAAL